MTAVAAKERIEVRVRDADKECISRAAEIEGTTVSTFIRTAALRAASSLIRSREPTLSQEEGRRFVEALNRPFEPNRALSKAMKKGDKLGI